MNKPTVIERLLDATVVRIACGANHVAMLTGDPAAERQRVASFHTDESRAGARLREDASLELVWSYPSCVLPRLTSPPLTPPPPPRSPRAAPTQRPQDSGGAGGAGTPPTSTHTFDIVIPPHIYFPFRPFSPLQRWRRNARSDSRRSDASSCWLASTSSALSPLVSEEAAGARQ